MNKKYNQFNTIFENTITKYTNGGFSIGSFVIVQPAFLKSKYYKEHYSEDDAFENFIKSAIENKTFFAVKECLGYLTSNTSKIGNSNEGVGPGYLKLGADTRSLKSEQAFSEFIVPANKKYVDVIDFGNNVAPVQGVPNRYEYHNPEAGKPTPLDDEPFRKIGNRPTDDQLPKSNKKSKRK